MIEKIFYKLIFILLFFPFIFFAQNHTSGKIAGSVLNEATGHSLEHVSVSLHKRSDSSIISGNITDRMGRFEINNVPEGDYYLKFFLIGYKEKLSKSFKLSPQQTLNLGKFVLAEAMINLDEVLVESKKVLFNNSIDRKVYNVEQDILSKAGSASELLQNVPSVQVDIDGNISLRGSTSVLILINGKNSPLMGKNRAEVLQQMPASSIEKIELITNPSAKYKPDGTSGIINIVLKKNTSLGVNANLTANAGNDDRYNSNIIWNYSPGSYNIFGSYSIRKDNRNRINEDNRTQVNSSSEISYYKDNLLSSSAPVSHMVSLGMDYKFDKKNEAGISGNYFYNGFTRDENSQKVIRDVNLILTDEYGRKRIDYEYEKEYGLKLFFEHNFPEEDHKIRFEYSLEGQPEQEDNHYTNISSFPPRPENYDNTLIKQNERKNQISLDYSNPISEISNLEIGYEGEFNSRDQNLFAEYFDNRAHLFIKDLAKTNDFRFDEAVHAVYATYKHSFDKFGVLAGMRAEKALMKSNMITTGQIVENDYFSIYPTLHTSYKFSEFAELQLNYSRRIRRPEGDDLNPFPEYRDARNISAGNPYLKPEYIQSIEFGCNFQYDIFSILSGVYYRYTTNRFTSLTTQINDSTLLTTKENLSTDKSTGYEMIVSINGSEYFTAHANLNIFYNTIDASNLGYSNNKSVFTWSSAFTGNLNFTSNTMLQFNFNYNSKRLSPQGNYSPSFVLNMGFRQELFENKLSLTATVADLFKTMKRELNLDIPTLNQTVINKRDSRVFYFGFTYHFGSNKKKSKEDQIKYDNNI